MDTEERVTYARAAFDLEFMDSPLHVMFIDEQTWNERFMNREDVDPLAAHKPYGLTAPQRVRDRWVIGFSATHLVAAVEHLDNDGFSRWLEYWLVHTLSHLTVLSRAAENGESNLLLTEIEERVDTEIRHIGEALYEFGERVKLLRA